MNQFVELKNEELMLVEGGGWPGADLVTAVFECGRELGRAIVSAFK